MLDPGRLLTALALLLTGIGLLATTMGAKYADLGGAFSPMFFPRIVLGLLVALAAVDLAVAVRVRRKPGEGEPARWGRVAVVGAALAAYAWFLTTAGFLIASIVFCAVILVTLGERGWLRIGLFAVGLPGVLVILFNHLLRLPLPTSPFSYLF